MTMRSQMVLAGLAVLVVAAVAPAQSGDAATKLNKATQNPVGDLVSIPVQFNSFSGGGIAGTTLSNVNVQPVLPLSVGRHWNLIARTIVPFFNAPMGDGSRARGVGDIQVQAMLTPTKASKFVWGLGPMFSLPTATNVAVRTGDWAVGPVGVVVLDAGPFVLGTLASQLWTIADDRDDASQINQLSVQPFINYNLPRGWALVFAPIILANWQVPDDDVWTVPVGMGVSRVTAIGRQPVSVGVQYYANVIRPDATAHSQVKFVVSLLFPKA